MKIHVLLDLGVLFDKWKAARNVIFFGRVNFGLVFLAVTQRMVHIVVDEADWALVLSEVALIVSDAQHHFAFPIQSLVVVRIVSKCSVMWLRRGLP